MLLAPHMHFTLRTSKCIYVGAAPKRLHRNGCRSHWKSTNVLISMALLRVKWCVCLSCIVHIKQFMSMYSKFLSLTITHDRYWGSTPWTRCQWILLRLQICSRVRMLCRQIPSPLAIMDCHVTQNVPMEHQANLEVKMEISPRNPRSPKQRLHHKKLPQFLGSIGMFFLKRMYFEGVVCFSSTVLFINKVRNMILTECIWGKWDCIKSDPWSEKYLACKQKYLYIGYIYILYGVRYNQFIYFV